MRDLKIFFYIKSKDKEKKKKAPDGLSTIYCSLTYLDTKTTFSTGIKITQTDWEKTNQLSKKNLNEEQEKMAGKLADQKKAIRIAKEKLLILNQPVTASILKADVFPKKAIKQKEVPTEKTYKLLDVMREFVQEKETLVKLNRRSKGTLTKYETTYRHVEAFLKANGNEDITLNELKYKLLKDFYIYLLSEKVTGNMTKKGICNDTSQKYIQAFRGAVFYAIDSDYIEGDPFKKWKYEWDEVKTVYLTKSELAQIENQQFSNKRLETVKDIFLFTCYTGFAPIDLKHITWDNIELRENNKYWFNVPRKKTKVNCEVMMFSRTKALINKYKEDPWCQNKNMLMPYRANQTVNEYLKEIADHCGITKNLTHYVGRHTFATTTMLSRGASLEVTKKALGHKRITQTEHYAKIVDSKTKREMYQVDEDMLMDDFEIKESESKLSENLDSTAFEVDDFYLRRKAKK